MVTTAICEVNFTLVILHLTPVSAIHPAINITKVGKAHKTQKTANGDERIHVSKMSVGQDV